MERLVISFGSVSIGAGSAWQRVTVTGLDDLPDQRPGDQPRVLDSGDWPGTDFLGPRWIQVEALSLGVTADVLTAMRSATEPGVDRVLTIAGLTGMPAVQVTGRWRRRSLPTDRQRALGQLTRVALQFYAPDPRLYDAAETVLTTGPGASTSGGLAPPLTPPLTPSGSGSGGQVQAVNAGNTATRPLLRVDGPAPGFDLLQLTTGRALRYRQALAAGDFVVIDTDARTVLLNGTASRRSALSGAWWDLPPGVSDVRYLPTGPAVGSAFTMRFRSAWL